MPSLRPAHLAVAGAAVYGAAVTWYLLTHGGWPTPDFLIPPLLLLALCLRRGRTFLLDWTPFLALLLAWEATRGVADLIGSTVHIEEPIRLERALFFGRLPTIELQRLLYDEERGSRWYDWVGAGLHALHFVLPVVFGFALWLRDRTLYWRYVASVLALFLLGFVGFVLFPQAPPWYASVAIDGLPYIPRIGVGTVLSLPVEGQIRFVYAHVRPNDVAAMPSLHAALPVLLTLILWRVRRPLAYAGAVYSLVIGFFLVYHGEHYVIDLLAGWALAGFVYWTIWATPAWLRRRLPASTPARRAALALPATALAAAVLVVGTAAALRPGAFGTAPTALLPESVEPAEQATAPPPANEHLVLEGPCGVSRSLTGLADERLASVAGVYAAYLIDPNVGLCLALTEEQPLHPPPPEEQPMIAAESGPPNAPSASVTIEPGAPRGLRFSAAGTPNPGLIAAGMPPGAYILVVLLREVPDAEAARTAVAGVATAIFDER